MECPPCSSQPFPDDYFKWVKGQEEVDMGWISVGTFVALRHREDPARGGFAAHLLVPVFDGSVMENVHRFIAASQAKLGNELRAILRGAAIFSHMSLPLQKRQQEARKILIQFLEGNGIDVDVQWAANDVLTQCIFDAETGQCSTETMPYVRTTD
ncbi:MAG: hypothetical protein PHI23_01615 [Candidatus Peribacteraceae bacterium]|nr:hypothetical protein [Candidatus Peribacteraceae bacterium]